MLVCKTGVKSDHYEEVSTTRMDRQTIHFECTVNHLGYIFRTRCRFEFLKEGVSGASESIWLVT